MRRSLSTLALCVILTQLEYPIASDFAPQGKVVVKITVSLCKGIEPGKPQIEVLRQLYILDQPAGAPTRDVFMTDGTPPPTVMESQ